MRKILLFISVLFLASTVSAIGPKGGSGGNISPNADLTVSSFNVKNQLLVGETSAISTFTPTAITFDDGVTLTNNGTTALNGNTTVGASALLQATSATVTNQQLFGTGGAISTFTPTALTLDDGAILTVNSTDAGAVDIAGGLNIGSGNVALIGTDGKINGPLSSTIIDDLSGANLTSLTAANISAGSLGANVIASSVTQAAVTAFAPGLATDQTFSGANTFSNHVIASSEPAVGSTPTVNAFTWMNIPAAAGSISVSAGSPSILDGVNLSSVTDVSGGNIGISFATNFADTNYWCVGSADNSGAFVISFTAKQVQSIQADTQLSTTGTDTDNISFSFACWGRQ